MADNITVTPGTGATIAADEVTIDGATALVQRVKPVWGVAGSGVDVSASNPLPVVQTGALPAGTALVGKVGIDQTTPGTTNAVAATGNVAHDAVDSGNPIKFGAVARSAAPSAVAAGDRVDLSADLYGSLRTLAVDSTGAVIDQTATVNVAQDTAVMKNGATSLTPKFAIIACSSSGNNEIVAAVSGKKIRVLSYNFTGADAVNAKWRSASTDKTGLTYIPQAGAGKAIGFSPVGHFETAAGDALNLNLSAAVAVGGEVTYIEV